MEGVASPIMSNGPGHSHKDLVFPVSVKGSFSIHLIFGLFLKQQDTGLGARVRLKGFLWQVHTRYHSGLAQNPPA